MHSLNHYRETLINSLQIEHILLKAQWKYIILSHLKNVAIVCSLGSL